jgi:flavin reductase (DIM6/NTAB) family NADH-FMN oxidoreductase RutF
MRFDSSDTPPDVLYRLLAATVIPRPIAWVSTKSADGTLNAAPFSFFNVMGDEPPILAIGINRGRQGMKDTARNILETGEFVVNLVPEALAEAMNATSIDAPHGTSEFALAGLTPAPSTHVAPPRIAESPVSFECVTHASLVTGPSQLIAIGRVLAIHVEDQYVLNPERGHVDARSLGMLGRGFGTTYIRSHDTFEMTRPKWTAPSGPSDA